MAYHPNQTTRRPEPEPRPTRRDGRPWVWALVGCVVLVGLFAFGAAAQSFGDRPDADAKAATPTTPGTGAAGAGAAKPRATKPPAADAEPAVAKIGSAVRDGQFEFVVTGLDCGKSTIGSKILNLSADGKYCVVTVSIRNAGDQSRIFSGKSQKAYDADGTKFSSDTEAEFYANDGEQTLVKKISPGDKLTEKLVFDVPKSTRLTTLELHDSFLSGGVKVSLKK